MKYKLLLSTASSKKKQYSNSWNKTDISREELRFCTCSDSKKSSNSTRQWCAWLWMWSHQCRLTCLLMKNYFFKVSSNTVNFIIETVILYNASSIKNISILYKFVIKIRSTISVQFQNMIIIIIFFRTNQTDIIT